MYSINYTHQFKKDMRKCVSLKSCIFAPTIYLRSYDDNNISAS